MPVAKMEKINILSNSSEKAKLLSLLRSSGLIDIREFREVPREISSRSVLKKRELDFDYELAELKNAIGFLEETGTKKKGFIEGIVGYKHPVHEDELEANFKGFPYKETIEKCKALTLEMGNIRSLIEKLREDLHKLLPWEKLDMPLAALRGTPNTKMLIGTVANKKEPVLKAEMSSTDELYEISAVERTKTHTRLLILYHASREEGVLAAAAKAELERADLSMFNDTASKEIRKILGLMDEARNDLKEALKEAGALQADKLPLMCVHDHLFQQRIDHEVGQRLIATKSVFAIEGWIVGKDLKKLENLIRGTMVPAKIYSVRPEEGEDAPVVLENHPLLKPFETITRTFGLPRASEIDPTFPLSVFFFVFFGMCLSDAAYGIIMMAASIYMLKKLQLSDGGKRLMWLLFIGGVSTIIFGSVMGGWFGIDIDAMPEGFGALKNILTSLRLINPIKDPLTLLGISVGLGVIQVMFGLALMAVEKARQGRLSDVLIDDIPWMLFLTALVSFVATKFAGLAASSILGWASAAGAIYLVLTQGRHKSNPVMKIISGLLSLYKTTGYMGDALSYSRLLALGMTTSIIGMVVNLIASMTLSVPVVGFFIMALILVIGHTFNLVISLLGAFIHSMRLQLVEFFGKFYEGGGKEFKPYGTETKYTLIVSRR